MSIRVNIKKLDDLKKLKDVVKPILGQALKSDVEETVRAVVESHIQTDVYDDYKHPKVYERRYDNGGLIDRDNIVGFVDLNGKSVARYKARLFVENITPKNPTQYLFTKGKGGGREIVNVPYASDDYLTPVIETGKGYMYDWENDEGMENPPRPFMSNAAQDLKLHQDILEKDLKNGIRRAGVKVK